MKKLILVLSLGAALLLSHTASASGRFYDRHYGGYDRWDRGSFFRGGFSRHDSFYRNRYRGGYYRDNFYRNSFYRNNFVGFSYGRHPALYRGGFYGGYRGFRRNDAGDFLGGLVVGSLLTNSIQSSRDSYRDNERVVYRSAPVTRSRAVVVNRSSAPATNSSKRRLLRDLNGNCFEIYRNATGDEVRAEIDPGNCRF